MARTLVYQVRPAGFNGSACGIDKDGAGPV